MSRIKTIFFTLLLGVTFLLINSCIMAPDTYDNGPDDGLYTGKTTTYILPSTDDENIKIRACPDYKVEMRVLAGKINFYAYEVFRGGYSPDASHVKDHTSDVYSFENNKFEIEHRTPIVSNTDISDLQALGFCDSGPGDSALLGNFLMKIDESEGLVGQYGIGKATAVIVNGIECTDGRFFRTCAHFMNLVK